MQQYLEILKKGIIWKDLDEEKLKRFLEISKIEKHQSGSRIVKEGECEEELYFLLPGPCFINKDSGDGEKVFITNIEEGEHFGEAGLLIDCKRTSNVLADSDIVVAKINKANFLTFLNEDPQNGVKFLLNMLSLVFTRLKHTTHELKFERRDFLVQDAIDAMFK